MKGRSAALFLSLALSSAVFADDHNPLHASFSTLITTPEAIEGLTNDADGNLYTPARAGSNCPVYRVPLDNPSVTRVGIIPGTCSPSGLAFGTDGMLYVTQGDKIYRFKPDAASPPTATVFASGVPGTNGVAFDRQGNLWTGDGTTGQGRVWRIRPDGSVKEMFRIPAMANDVNAVDGVGGVGRDVRTLPPGAITITDTSRNAQNILGSQALVANGLQFFGDRLYIADTARGAIWRVAVDRDGEVHAYMGCDKTFTANTLCMDQVVVQHPYLEGADGIVLDEAGNIWVSANERNAVVFVARNGRVTEAFRNPLNEDNPAAAGAPPKLRNVGPLESPTSPVLVGHKLCTANSDGNRRDNSPSAAGEIGGSGQPKGKISCLDQRVNVPGLQLPIR